MEELQLQRGLQQLNTIDDAHKYGKLGYTIKNVFRIRVLRFPSKYYVRFPDGTFVMAFHGPINVSESITNKEITVELEKNNDNYSIKGTAPAEQDAQEQVHEDIYSHPYEHTHPITDMAWINNHAFTDGNVLIANGASFDSVPQSELVTSSTGGSGWFSQLKVISTVVTTPVNTVTILTQSLVILSGGGLILNGELRIID